MTPRVPASDPLHKATITFRQHGVAVDLDLLEGVFAGAGVDAGTRQLLRWLATERYAKARSVLDLGCGYGPLGLWLAAASADRHVLAVDRDARAVEATTRGAARNTVDDRMDVVGSLGFDDVGARRFDLIVSNVPAKVGPSGLRHLLLDGFHRLSDDGVVAVVVVARLAPDVESLLADPAVGVLDVRRTRTYTTFEYGFHGEPAGSSAEPGFQRGMYRRGRSSFDAGPLHWDAETSFSIPEFDTLGRGTIAALQVLPGRSADPTVIVGVGQGHLGLGLRAAGFDGEVRLVDRDLLALRTAASNLAGDRVRIRHADRPRREDMEGAGVALVELPEREPVSTTAAVLAPALGGSEPAEAVIVHGRSADVGRVLELLPRHGVRLDVHQRVKVATHAAVRATVRHLRRS